MGNSLIDSLMTNLEELKGNLGEKLGKQLNLALLERVVKRLQSFSPECEQCEQHLEGLSVHIENLKSKHGQIEKSDLKEHQRKVNIIISHLQKEHKLVTEGYYMGVYMSLGMSIGLVFGLTIFENIALGLPIGMIMGIAIGVGLDADAKKKGLQI